MNLQKSAALKQINQSRSVDAIRVSVDDTNQKNLVKDIKSELDKRMRTKKNFTIILLE
jgi:hypothetical protein